MTAPSAVLPPSGGVMVLMGSPIPVLHERRQATAGAARPMEEGGGKRTPRPRRKPPTTAATAKAIVDAAATRGGLQETAEKLLHLQRAVAEQGALGAKSLLDQAGGLDRLKLGIASLTAPNPELLKAIEQLQKDAERRREMYRGIIDSASTSARQAYERSSQPGLAMAMIKPVPSTAAQQVAVLEELHTEVSRVAGTVGDMATSIVSLAVVAERAEGALDELAVLSKATLDESARLRDALVAGQTAATRAAWVIGILTAVLVVLTVVLAWKAIIP